MALDPDSVLLQVEAHLLEEDRASGRYRFVHTAERKSGAVEVLGRGRARLQRRQDGRLEVVDEWSDDTGSHGRRVLVERHDS